jgi:micrococcal nuclease
MALCAALALGAAGCGGAATCGPASGTAAAVIDGDTIVLSTGEHVRYLLVDTPEITMGKDECYGAQARAFNRSLVLGRTVELSYDRECRDRYGRLLAYVSVAGTEVDALLVSRGYGCVLHIPPNGADRLSEYKSLEASARAQGLGLWGACDPAPCGP